MDRRRVLLLLAGAGCAAGLGAVAAPRRNFGFGPVAIGMPQAEAMDALGPGAFRTALCSGVDGALYDWRDDRFRMPEDVPVPAMVMFGGAGGAVSEVEASISYPDGGWALEDWRSLAEAQTRELGRRAGGPAFLTPAREDDLGAEHVVRWTRPEGEVSLQARWMRRSGAVFTRMHWIAAGAASVIG